MLGGPQGRSGQVRKISPTPGFDRRTVQPVASRYTDCATGPTDGVLTLALLDVPYGVVFKQISTSELFLPAPSQNLTLLLSRRKFGAVRSTS
jgi:hypothetical protein